MRLWNGNMYDWMWQYDGKGKPAVTTVITEKQQEIWFCAFDGQNWYLFIEVVADIVD